MEITIFAKHRTTKEGKPFTSYLTTLEKKSGEKLTCQVRFVAPCTAPAPESCPRNVVIEKDDCNLATRQYTDVNTGDIKYSSTLWIKAWTDGTPYVDTSMDEYF